MLTAQRPAEIQSVIKPGMCSIIIPTYNTRELTIACLKKIETYPPTASYEIILVDNNSSDRTCDEVQRLFPKVITLRNAENLGFARACNRAASIANGDYFLFLNSDTEPLENTFKNLLDWMENHPKTGMAGPELIGPENDLLQMSWSWHPLLGGELLNRFFAPQHIKASKMRRWLIRHLQKGPRAVPYICGACLLVRRETFKQLGGFDENFELYFEDADLSRRCGRAGWHVDFVPQSKIIHHLGQSTKRTFSISSLIYQQSHITYYRKHGSSFSILLLKLYLRLKWLRYWLFPHLKFENQIEADTLGPSHLQVIMESARLTMEAVMAPAGAINGPSHLNGLRKLHLGCGHDIREGWINLDAARLQGVNVVHDIEQIPWPFESESFDRIRAHQLLEHVEYIPVLREAHRILKKGGVFEVAVPHFTSRNNWIDPTHKKVFSIRTFEFFVENSRFGREYYFNFLFSHLRRQKLIFEKGWLFYNYLVELLINIHPKFAVFYEATFLHSLFPAESVLVELEK